MSRSMRQAVVPAFLFLCLVLGGSAQGVIGPLILQLLAIALLTWAALRHSRTDLAAPARSLLIVATVAVSLIALHLVPMPPPIWSKLPGRSFVAEGYEVFGGPLPWLPLSLAPYRTMGQLLFLLPPLAVIAGTLILDGYKRSWLAVAIVGATLLSVGLGALQVTGGGTPGTSPWYPYRISNEGVAVGFFANSSHLASLMLASLPFIGAAVANQLRRSSRRKAQVLSLAVPSLLVILLGLLLNQSMAGLLLAFPVALASAALVWGDHPLVQRWLLVTAGLGAVAAAAGTTLVPPTAGDTAVSISTRGQIYARATQAAADFMPVGSGFGSFPQLYPRYESTLR